MLLLLGRIRMHILILGSPSESSHMNLNIFVTPPILESAAESEELRTWLLRRLVVFQSEEGVMLDSAFPKMLSSLVGCKLEDECVQLNLPGFGLVCVFLNHQRQLLEFEVEADDLLPKEESDLLLSIENNQAGRRESQLVFISVSSLHTMHINAVQLEPFHLVEIGQFRLGRGESMAVG